MAADLADRSPEAVAEAFLAESMRRMDSPEMNAVSRMTEAEETAFAAGMAAGRWSRELATALESRQS